MKYLKGREIPVLSRMIVAIGLAIGLLSLFQNCSKVNFANDSKALVQGAVTAAVTTSSSTTAPTSAATPVVSSTSSTDVGICVLTCANTNLNTEDEHELSQNGSCKAPPTCELEEDGSGMPVKSVLQTVSNSDALPKTVCVSKQACLLIATNLSSGRLILMKTTNNKVSTLKDTSFEPVASADDCQDVLTDDEVKDQFENET